MKILALSGKMHSGKSYIAEYVAKYHAFQRLSLAGPLKRDILDMGFDPVHVAEKPPWMRKLMQVYGQARRAENEDHWVDKLYQDIIGLGDRGMDRVVTDDVRFPNEIRKLELAADAFGWDLQVVRVVRADYDYSCIAGHDDESETVLDHYRNFDAWFIANSGDVGKLIKATRCTLYYDWGIGEYPYGQSDDDGIPGNAPQEPVGSV